MNIFKRQEIVEKQRNDYCNNNVQFVKSKSRLIYIKDELSRKRLAVTSIISYNIGLIITMYCIHGILYKAIIILLVIGFDSILIPKAYTEIKSLNKRKREEIIYMDNLEKSIKEYKEALK